MRKIGLLALLSIVVATIFILSKERPESSENGQGIPIIKEDGHIAIPPLSIA